MTCLWCFLFLVLVFWAVWPMPVLALVYSRFGECPRLGFLDGQGDHVLRRTMTRSRVDAAADEARADRFDAFLKQMSKERPGEVLRLDDESVAAVDVIPTGALSLDVALGVGGFPRGRIVELFGPFMSGKCLVKGTYVWTDAGLETVEELFERCGLKADATSRVTEVKDFDVRAVNEAGELEAIEALTHNYVRPTLKVCLDSGREVEATSNHPLRVLDSSGNIVWRRVGEMVPGDVVVSATFGAEESSGASHLNEDEAVLLGYLVAEGTMSERHLVQFTNFDPQVGREFSDVAERVLGFRPCNPVEGSYAISRTSVRTVLADQYGLDYVTAAGKTVPHVVRTAGAKAQAAFLSALYEGDGWTRHGPSVGLTSASETLARQVQLLLYGLGIPASFSSKFNATYQRDYYNVLVGPGAFHRFCEVVGFRSARRAAQVEVHDRKTCGWTNFENIPNLVGPLNVLRDAVGGDRDFDRIVSNVTHGSLDCTRAVLAQVFAWCEGRHLNGTARRVVAQLTELAESRYTFERVVSVSDAGLQPTFDLVLPATHSFLANGVVSHNTSVALSAAAQCQSMGGKVGFVDAEHSLNKELALAMGVDPHELVLFQPSSGEEAIDMVEKMVASGAFDMVIVDSVAAMVPQAEIDAEIDQQHMALHARLMSKFMRRVAGPVSDQNVCLVLINQVRVNLGAYGAPDTTTGGKAIPFFSSVRVEVRSSPSKKIERGSGQNKEVIGQTVTCTVKKNKMAAPFRVATFDLIFGQGIASEGSLLEVCRQLGLITNAGAFFTDVTTGERIGQGQEAVKLRLEADPEMAQRLTAAVYEELDRRRHPVAEPDSDPAELSALREAAAVAAGFESVDAAVEAGFEFPAELADVAGEADSSDD
jgi:recombination protein RecA